MQAVLQTHASTRLQIFVVFAADTQPEFQTCKLPLCVRICLCKVARFEGRVVGVDTCMRRTVASEMEV